MSFLTESHDKTNGRWTKQQHQNFLLGLQMYGKNWKKIEELIGTRNGSQIRSHAQKFFLKVKKTYSQDSNSVDSISEAQKDIETNNSSSTSSNKQIVVKLTDYSYFLGKIVEYSMSQGGPLGFWENLIDHQEMGKQTSEIFLSRKNSSQCGEEQLKRIDKLCF